MAAKRVGRLAFGAARCRSTSSAAVLGLLGAMLGLQRAARPPRRSCRSASSAALEFGGDAAARPPRRALSITLLKDLLVRQKPLAIGADDVK